MVEKTFCTYTCNYVRHCTTSSVGDKWCGFPEVLLLVTLTIWNIIINVKVSENPVIHWNVGVFSGAIEVFRIDYH